MSTGGTDTDELLRRADDGDATAVQELLSRHRGRLRHMVSVRMDPRLAARLDPSDVVQEALAEAFRALPDYLRRRPLPFYAWVRRLAWQRLVQLHRKHIHTQKRSVTREEPREMGLSNESVMELADQLVGAGTSPSGRLVRQEMFARVRSALERLASSDREILILRHLEQLSVQEAAEVLEITRTAASTRHFRAMQRLQRLLEAPAEESSDA
jgi:RNA polymerase sigma-70 factor (ECF subfamily)